MKIDASTKEKEKGEKQYTATLLHHITQRQTKQ